MQASDLGIRLALMVVVFTYGGFKLDQWLDSQPILLIVGAFLGLGGGMWSAVRSVNRLTGREPSPPAPGETGEEGDDGPA
jgi:F0F1-type ATP synthase assembly protein I